MFILILLPYIIGGSVVILFIMLLAYIKKFIMVKPVVLLAIVCTSKLILGVAVINIVILLYYVVDWRILGITYDPTLFYSLLFYRIACSYLCAGLVRGDEVSLYVGNSHVEEQTQTHDFDNRRMTIRTTETVRTNTHINTNSTTGIDNSSYSVGNITYAVYTSSTAMLSSVGNAGYNALSTVGNSTINVGSYLWSSVLNIGAYIWDAGASAGSYIGSGCSTVGNTCGNLPSNIYNTLFGHSNNYQAYLDEVRRNKQWLLEKQEFYRNKKVTVVDGYYNVNNIHLAKSVHLRTAIRDTLMDYCLEHGTRDLYLNCKSLRDNIKSIDYCNKYTRVYALGVVSTDQCYELEKYIINDDALKNGVGITVGVSTIGIDVPCCIVGEVGANDKFTGKFNVVGVLSSRTMSQEVDNLSRTCTLDKLVDNGYTTRVLVHESNRKHIVVGKDPVDKGELYQRIASTLNTLYKVEIKK